MFKVVIEMTDNTTAHKLLQAFMQFNKAEWNRRTIEGHKPSEMTVMFCIKKKMKPNTPGMMVSEISSLLHVTSPTITQLIKGLETKGLVERTIDPSDRRAVRIKLTDKGEKVTAKAEAVFNLSFNGLISYLGEEESNLLADLLFKVFTYYKENPVCLEDIESSGDDEA